MTKMAAKAYDSLDVAELANVPAILTEGKKFVCWREVIRNDKTTKVHRDTMRGVGRMFDPADGIMGVDFDDCLDDHGNIIAGHDAAEWLPRLNSYSEVSPSSRGVKVLLLASHALDGKTGKRDSKRGVEIYRERRFFTLTGKVLSQFSGKVEPRQTPIDEFFSSIFGAKKAAATKPPVTPTIITSASPRKMILIASPITVLPDASSRVSE